MFDPLYKYAEYLCVTCDILIFITVFHDLSGKWSTIKIHL